MPKKLFSGDKGGKIFYDCSFENADECHSNKRKVKSFIINSNSYYNLFTLASAKKVIIHNGRKNLIK